MWGTKIGVIMVFLCLPAGGIQAAQPLGIDPFDFDSVRTIALHLSQQPYSPPETDLPRGLQGLNYDTYRAIQYKRDKAVWTGQAIAFRLEFFPRGYLYKNRVDMNLIEDGKITPVEFRPDLFQIDHGRLEGVKAGIGFAGLQILYCPPEHDLYDDIASFLGASYFRAIPVGGIYGASARGIAVDTAVAGKKEEFPAFRKFWIVRPAAGEDTLTVYALLDGADLTGAYRFDITPGTETKILAHASLFIRRPIQALGLAPLTSMYFYGPGRNAGPGKPDKRPQVHDSGGLLLETGAGRWIWRPLQNPMQNRFSSFGTGGVLKGFGLLQRDRRAADYMDANTKPQKRPSIWIEPVGPWPPGRVDLLELAAEGDWMDNIVAQYVLTDSPPPGKELTIAYRLGFYSDSRTLHDSARVVQTLRKVLPGGDLRCEVRFEGKNLGTSAMSDLKPLVTAEGADIAGIHLKKVGDETDRLQFRVIPPKNSGVIEIRASLLSGGETVSEIWSDQWKP